MKRYFQLFEECLLVNNSNDGGAVYNLISGDVFTYKISETNILALCEKKNSIDNISKSLNILHEYLISFFDKLVEANLGFYSDEPVYVEKMIIDYNWMELSYLNERPVVERAFILLNSKCDCDCYYCNENSIRMNSCVGCFKDTDIINGTTTTYDDYAIALDYLKLLGTNTIFFSGGNFFQDFYRNIKVIKYAKEISIKNILLYLGNNQNINQEYWGILKQLDINIYIQIPILDEKSIHNNLLINSIKGILPFSVILLFDIMHDTEFKKEVIEDCSSTFIPKEIYTDLVINTSRNDSILNNNLYELKRTSIQDYNIRHVYNTCMHGLLTITSHKTVTICPKINEPLGKIDDFTNLTSSKKLNQFWKLTKDKIEKCKGCNIRYICKDCRYIEKKLSGSINESRLCAACNLSK
ncbi:hypothetical protein RZO55_25290 [Clostridium boliviensis]|uniref:Radical SAM protein n=1 Tax=Clostridium boliviensis TaxID=318465 RepID=A0ABU4GTK2_9CLOT|nr:hypothetical protein [Clostridium boliviensis]MDW2800888.1 hypothetical protein [Clostridium boliviensis]